jgi:RNA polymerase sigma-70 factor (ECF subfamily)
VIWIENFSQIAIHFSTTKYKFRQICYSEARAGFNGCMEILHPSLGRQRGSGETKARERTENKPPQFGRKSLILWKLRKPNTSGRTAQTVQQKRVTPHPNECGREKENLTEPQKKSSSGLSRVSLGRVNPSKANPGKADLGEAEAIERAKLGDAEAFQVLYDKHKRRVYSLCLRMTANTAEAEDLAQEAFLQLYRKIATFRGESAFSTWLHRLAVNVVLMHLRKKTLPSVSLEETTQGTDEDSPRKDFGADDVALAGSIDRMQLQRAVNDLPPGYRQIFVLHDVEGYEHNEIAGLVGCSIGNSKSQLHKARMKLRDLLKMKRAEKAG